MTPDKYNVIEALAKYKSVLLFGPPGTGKTKLVSEIITYLTTRDSVGGRPIFRLGSTNDRFGTTFADLPEELNIEWITFHQGYSYEEFIIGKRPKPKEGGIILEPHFGILMSMAVRISLGGDNQGCLIIIDEINRANASQVFGEFITLMDLEYRRTIRGEPNVDALKIRLPGIAYESGKSETISMLRGGGKYNLPEDWTFPEHMYVLATMNSVDKAALPLDSALTRRLHRIEMLPNIEFLAEKLDTDLSELEAKAIAIRETEKSIDTLTVEETTIMLIDRLNVRIAIDIGEDFELGHGLVWRVVDAEKEHKWATLINIWDHVLLPQLMERYAGRTEGLRELLKIAPDSPTKEAFSDRAQIGAAPSIDAPIKIRPLYQFPPLQAEKVLRHLAI